MHNCTIIVNEQECKPCEHEIVEIKLPRKAAHKLAKWERKYRTASKRLHKQIEKALKKRLKGSPLKHDQISQMVLTEITREVVMKNHWAKRLSRNM